MEELANIVRSVLQADRECPCNDDHESLLGPLEDRIANAVLASAWFERQRSAIVPAAD